MTDKVTVNVAVPVYGPQYSEWWFPVMNRLLTWQKQGIEVLPISVSGAMPDISKNTAATAHMMGNNTGITSAQRNGLIHAMKAEWIFFLDHDTLPPVDALPRLLAHQHPFVAGVYYHRGAPYAPLMYRRVENGLYKIIYDFERGALMPVDAVGMGCTLIHRSVFETIYQHYVHFMRHNGTSMIIHRDDIVQDDMPLRYHHAEPKVFRGSRGWNLVTPLKPMEVQREENAPFPFYHMEEGRTEDIVFCERAIRVGFVPLVDTTIECQHWNPMAITGDWFREAREAEKIVGVDRPVTEVLP